MNNAKIAVIGLGYVGLPLAVAFAKKYDTVGFDTNVSRIKSLQQLQDHTQEADPLELGRVLKKDSSVGPGLILASAPEFLNACQIFVITVPTPIDSFKLPDLEPLLKATRMVGDVLKKGDLVIYESTVYPGCTEEDCVPILEKRSGLRFNHDFSVGYSPERISPGDKEHHLAAIVKVTSGSSAEAAKRVDDLYRSIITAGTHLAPSIRVAEAAKAIENAQRDVNISFVNELALIFDRLGIDTGDVLEAAATKWNFLPFKPGLVGGHCIGVDPYYLAHKAQSLGYHPEVILSGRRVNDTMGAFVAAKVTKLMIQKDIPVKGANALILGITFKENCPDVRNTRVVDIYRELEQFGLNVDLFDPWADTNQVTEEYHITMLPNLITTTKRYDTIVLAVAHSIFLRLDYKALQNERSVLFDTKGCLPRSIVDARL
ncbi:UDP-N-acetyl-D-galactosamine dehydrogenase [bacterium A37T11]|nr:UDP-N-acetyl-D-galactosamine dehydrogenase [bacterium A37T11]